MVAQGHSSDRRVRLEARQVAWLMAGKLAGWTRVMVGRSMIGRIRVVSRDVSVGGLVEEVGGQVSYRHGRTSDTTSEKSWPGQGIIQAP